MSTTFGEQTTHKQKLRIILALAIPAVIENLLQTMVGFVDMLFVAKLGLEEVAAVGVTNAILAVYLAIFLAIGVGTSSLIARSIGAGEVQLAKKIAEQSTFLAIVVGIIFGIITLFFAEPLLRLMGAAPRVTSEGAVYFRIVGVSSVFISLMTIFGSILRSAGDTKTPMKVGLWINILHIILDYVLIFGVAVLPGFGLAGAAWASVVARVVGTVLLFLYIRRSSLAFPLRNALFPIKEYALPLVKLSVPTTVERLIMRLGQVLYFGLIIRIGTDVYAAHMIAGSIEVFAYMPGYGFAVAATTLVGQQLGAGRRKDAYSYGLLTTGVAIAIMTLIGIFLFFLSPWFSTWFTEDRLVIDMIVTALRIDAFALPALAVGLVIAGALQGAGDTKSPMYSTAIGMWLIRIIGVYVLCIYWDYGIAGVWISIAFDLWIRAVYLLIRFRKHMVQQ
ncbi:MULTISPECIES: MATE family efflux transporter [unclassified Paenibacillus]|uniref:MATE family efflux transporter n=1 Tax=unclassified Paenibacillus TaxID=185978 RepID=UPI001B708110|nr:MULTISPECIES: MATE family efflux transporter [unclassified Paenibacillus]MBP1154220.1 putative MATE family efflux protein [Paenibacillus sp. PvP091]MBP1170395.1 putative MATE family efflux protein [Paenibacillus sp. PvR098]MBP2441423.1 putative MATE family efflux protein [Paenibacillus sp. PvP052]